MYCATPSSLCLGCLERGDTHQSTATTIAMNQEPKETREERHTGKRLAAINELLAAHINEAPLPNSPGILSIVTAFGLDTRRDVCTVEADHKDAWDSIAAKDGTLMKDPFTRYVPQGMRKPDEKKTPTGGLTRAEILWNHVKPILLARLKFYVNRNLLPEWKQQEMKNIAKLTGFDYAGQWKEICNTTLPPPKSWGPGIDETTLEPTTVLAMWKRKKITAAQVAQAA